MKRYWQLVISVSSLLTACGQTPGDATREKDSLLILTDTARPGVPQSVQESTSNAVTAKGKGTTLFEERWIPGQPEGGNYEDRSRFLAHSHLFSNRQLLLQLDTSRTRVRQKAPRSDFAVADSMTVTGLGDREFFTKYCRIGSGLADGQIGGIAQTLVPERWERPSRAWTFDTIASKIRAIPTASVTCAVPDVD